MDTIKQYYKAEGYCIELIIEFFLCHNFQNTLKVFEKEIEESDFTLPNPYPKVKDRIKRNHVPLLMELLENYEHTEFFEKWTSLVPEEIRSSTEYKKLSIYIYTYYATIQYRNNEYNLISETSNNAVQKLTKTNGTFIIDKTFKIEERETSTVDNVEEDDSKDEDEDADSVIREYERDSLENDTDSSVDFNRKINLNEISAMDMFKIYLSENGSEFSNDPEFLPFFALPFIENPKLHPTFTKVFEEDWLNDLKEEMKQFLFNYSCGENVIPRIVKLCLKNEIQNNMKEDLSSSLVSEENIKRFKEMKRKFHRLKKDHQKLVGVANELSSALEKSVQGEAVNLKSTLTNCVQIFPDLFSSEIPSNQTVKWQTWENIRPRDERKLNYNQIDVQRIKQDLLHGSMKNKLLLLQALRWYITKSKCEEREHIITWFCRHDLLGLNTSFISDSLIPLTSPHPIQQSVVRVINALVSFNTGRDYIVSSKITVQLLMDVTKQSELDSITEDMIIAILQKLSLRRRLCELMIKNGILEWLLAKLDPGPLKKYTLEYTTSLIMNLSICITPSYWDNREHAIYSIIKLLKTTHKQVVEFVCGTLCCIIRSDIANTYCKNFGLDVYLTDSLNNHKDDGKLEKQIETLLTLHRREIEPNTLQMNSNLFSDDDLEDPEEVESEIDENDLVNGTPSGECLLTEHYGLVFTTPSVVERQTNKSPKYVLRPSTPRASSNIPSWARGSSLT